LGFGGLTRFWLAKLAKMPARRSKLVAMRKALWMIGLSVALLMFGGFFVLSCVVLVRHRHLSGGGLVMLVCNGYVAWIVLRQILLGAGELTGERPVAGSMA
jgi:hypothetical protein